MAIETADLVLAVGYQPVEHPPLAWNQGQDKAIIHIAPWRAAIEPGYQPVQELNGDIAAILVALEAFIRERDPAQTVRVGTVIDELLEKEDAGSAHPPSPLRIVRVVRDLLADDDVVALDNGAYKIWFARHYRAEAPHTLLLDNALATMGAGLGTAMAAARLPGSRRVLAVCGDGGFLMNVQDLETACRIGLDLTLLVVRDDAYGFIGWHQEEQGRERTGVALTNPDLSSLARSFGASAHPVTVDDPLEVALKRALDEPGVRLVDCPIDYSINELLSSDLHSRAQEALRRA